MITFHSRQSDCARRARKNENAGTFNFVSQIASPICTVMHTKRVKTDATIFKSRCSRTVVCYRFYRVEALPLSFVRFLRLANRSPMIQRYPARRSRDGRATSGKIAGKMSRAISAPFPGNGRAVANATPPDGHETIRKTTRSMTLNGHAASASQFAHRPMQHPGKYLASRLAGILPSRF